MSDLLLDMKPPHDFLVCIDSDGCILENMELKHKECFCPATVNVWDLQGVSRYAREAAEFVNLYSRTRGTNRFPALIRTLELTYGRREVRERDYTMPDLTPLKNWIQETPILSASAIKEYVHAHADAAPQLLQVARWSTEVDANVARIVRNIHPFPNVKEAMKKLGEFADVVIVSATPHVALERELTACGIDKLVTVIVGQELGTKEECIRKAMSGRYEADTVLKVGDAASDYAAAQANGVLFRPIIPGKESECWEQILNTSSDLFHKGQFRVEYMETLIRVFFDVLLEASPWET